MTPDACMRASDGLLDLRTMSRTREAVNVRTGNAGGAVVLFALACCFALSGLAALVYQTAWTREFALVFGTSELAVATVLAAYMGGLALEPPSSTGCCRASRDRCSATRCSNSVSAPPVSPSCPRSCTRAAPCSSRVWRTGCSPCRASTAAFRSIFSRHRVRCPRGACDPDGRHAAAARTPRRA